jgi:DNA adenine methylase
MPRIVRLLPDHDHYVSLFGGSGADILAKPPSKIETYNDLDEQVTNVFRVVLNGQFAELLRRLADTPARSRSIFDEAREIARSPVTDPVLSAWAVLVASHQSFVHMHPSLMGGSEFAFYVQPRKHFQRWENLPLAINFVRRRFRRVQLEARDWSYLVEKLDAPRTVFFADPPYHPDTMKPGQQIYTCEMSAEQHEAMLDRFLQVRGHVVLCGYANDVYDRMLASWRRIEVRTKTNMPQQAKAEDRTEVIWLNYDRNGKRL